MKRLLLAFVTLLAVDSALAATKIVVSCAPPTTREGGSLLLPSEIKDYSFWYQQPATTEQGPFVQPTCNYTVNIAVGSCIKAGTVFSGAVTDTAGALGLRGVATLAEDQCNPKPRPSAPVVTITVQ